MMFDRDNCPQCGGVWGFDEILLGRCFGCGWPEADDYADDEAQDPNDGNWCPECGEMRQLCQCGEDGEG